MYTVYGWCGQYGRCMVHTLAGAAGVAGAAGAWFIRTPTGHWPVATGHWPVALFKRRDRGRDTFNCPKCLYTVLALCAFTLAGYTEG